MGTDRDWEAWGASDPYFGVISADAFRRDAMDHDARARFFQSGESHVERVLGIVRDRLDTGFAPASVLDFGSGVGRLVVPFSKRAQRVVGVDVSPSMIAEATRNCEGHGIANASFVLSDDRLSAVEGTFDLVHSYIVLQHIAWARGRRILRSLAGRVAPRGVLAVQLLTSCKAPPLVRALARLRYRFPPANWARNLLRRRPLLEPAMQLHEYDLETTLADLASEGFRDFVQVAEPADDQPDFSSVFLFCRRGPA
jgi:SAM-dependent methyltransferase